MTAILVFAVVVVLGCALACTRRLYFATNPIAFHAAPWLAYVKRGQGDVVARAIARDPKADWEKELLAALSEPDEQTRTGKINEALFELEYRLSRWARVPRVCASIASSAGFLSGSMAIRYGLLSADEPGGEVIQGIVLQAVNVAALGVAGAAFAIAAQYRARKAQRAFQSDADALIDALEENL